MIFLPHYMWAENNKVIWLFEHKTSYKYTTFVHFGEKKFHIIDRIHAQFEKEKIQCEMSRIGFWISLTS